MIAAAVASAPAWAPAAMTAAGSMYNNSTQNKAIAAQNHQNNLAAAQSRSAIDAEDARQRAMEEEQFAAVRATTDASDPAALAERVMERANSDSNEFTQIDDYNGGDLQGQTSTGEISDSIGKMVGDAVARTKDMLKSQSVLSGQGAGMSGTQDGIVRLRDDVSNVGSDRRRSASVGRLEAQVTPATVTKSDSPLGDILMLAGTALGGAQGLAQGGATAGAQAGAQSASMPLNAIPKLGPINTTRAFRPGFYSGLY